MPRKPTVPAYRFHKPSGQAVVTLGGKDFYLGPHDSPDSRQSYDRLVAEWLDNGRQRPGPAPADLTVTELVSKFLIHATAFYVRPDSTPSGEATNFTQALRPLKHLYASTPAAGFGPKAFRAVRQHMIGLGWSRQGINAQMKRIRHVFKWAAGQELVPAAIHQTLAAVAGLSRGKSEAKESKKIKPVPVEVVEATLEFLTPPVQAMVRVQLLTGMRPGEVVIMRTGDIDRSADVWQYTPHYHKTEWREHERTIFIGPQAQEVLTPLLKLNPEAYIFDPRDAEAARYAACKTHRRPDQKPNQRKSDRTLGERYDAYAYRKAITRAADRADRWAHGVAAVGDKDRLVPRWHPNQLRHTAATQLRKQFGIEAARVILGHRSAGITEIYAEADQSKAQGIVRKIG